MTQTGLIGFFRRHPSYAILTFAQTLSIIGSALTTLVVYSVIEGRDTSVMTYAMVYVFSVTPGVVIAHFSHLYRHWFSIGGALITSTVFSAFALSLTWLGYRSDILGLLLCSELGLSLVAGFLAAYNSLYDKMNFAEEELEALTSVDTITFGAQTILGLMLGTFLLVVIDPLALIEVDAVTFLLALAIFVSLNALYRPKLAHRPPRQEAPTAIKDLTELQRRLFWIGPILAAFGGSLMALGPAMIDAKGFGQYPAFTTLSPVLLFLVVRALGQLTGPVIARRFDLERLAEQSYLLPVSLIIYCGLYGIIWRSGSVFVTYGTTFAAHIVSNIVFIVAYYSNLKFFSSEQISSVSSKAYVYGTLLGTASSIVGSLIADTFGFEVFFVVLGVVLAGFSLWTFAAARR
ncbi:MAG: hypothetical protein P8X51_03340 [Maritimibacter sp.]